MKVDKLKPRKLYLVLFIALGKWPVKFSVRLFVMSWLAFALIMDIAYSGSLISGLSVPYEAKPLDSFDQFLRMDPVERPFFVREDSLYR